MITPTVLLANQPPDRFYRGGPKIAAFRGVSDKGTHVPEDWVASVTCLAGEARLGLTILPGGRTLADTIADDPIGWLGAEHVANFGSDTKLLVKLLDAGQRLPVHAHPDVTFAHDYLGRTHGKAEAWYIIEGGVIYLGLKENLDRDTLSKVVTTQAVSEMLPLLHEIYVDAGDTVFVPTGTLHAIGEGIFLVELQEPEDLSILLEWTGFELDGEADGHLGLGFDVALGAVDCRGLSRAEVNSLITVRRVGESILSDLANPFFRLGRTAVNGITELEPGFRVLIVTDGVAQLHSANGYTGNLTKGATVVVPCAAGTLRLVGEAEILEARPPLPSSTVTAESSPWNQAHEE